MDITPPQVRRIASASAAHDRRPSEVGSRPKSEIVEFVRVRPVGEGWIDYQVQYANGTFGSHVQVNPQGVIA